MCSRNALALNEPLESKANTSRSYDLLEPNSAGSKNGMGVGHGSEGGAIFGSISNTDAVKTIQGYWTSFIRSFDPNKYKAAGAPDWQVWKGSSGMNRMGFEWKLPRSLAAKMEDVATEDPSQKKACDYLNSISVDIQQ